MSAYGPSCLEFRTPGWHPVGHTYRHALGFAAAAAAGTDIINCRYLRVRFVSRAANVCLWHIADVRKWSQAVC